MAGTYLTIGLYNLEISGCIGILDQEKIIPQTYLVNVEVSLSPEGIESTPDNLGASLSYEDLYNVVHKHFQRGGDLLEGLAVRIADDLLTGFKRVEKGKIEIVKLNPPIPGITGQAGIKYFFEK